MAAPNAETSQGARPAVGATADGCHEVGDLTSCNFAFAPYVFVITYLYFIYIEVVVTTASSVGNQGVLSPACCSARLYVPG